MANNYQKWSPLTNPGLGTFTNSFVNHNVGVSVTQTTPSATHLLPNSFNGKKFHVNNENISTDNVIVSVNTQTGLQTFSIPPGDSCIFVYTGNSVWDQIGGEEVIRNVAIAVGGGGGPVSSDQDQITRSIAFNSTPDTAPSTYFIGTVPAGFSVSDVTVDVITPFDGATVDTIRVETLAGPTIIMAADESDIRLVGNYTVAHNSVGQVATGDIQIVFNAPPSGGGATQGQLNVLVEFLSI